MDMYATQNELATSNFATLSVVFASYLTLDLWKVKWDSHSIKPLLQCVHVPATAVSLLIIAKHGCQASIYRVSAYWFSFLINRKGWRLDLKGTKRVLSPQSRSGKWTVFKFNVILCANLTPAFRSEVHIQTKGAANFVTIWSESFCLEHFKQYSITTLSPCTCWIYSVMLELTKHLQRK